jgi:proline iminopeptidase
MQLYPEEFEAFEAPIPQRERGDMMGAYYRYLTGDDEKKRQECASAWSIWEMTTSKLAVDAAYIKRAAANDKFALAFARIECHYFVNGGFFREDGQLIQDAKVLKDIPGVIVQGRYDLVCPAKTAHELHKAWPESELVYVQDAGHSCGEKGITSELVKATDKLRTLEW